MLIFHQFYHDGYFAKIIDMFCLVESLLVGEKYTAHSSTPERNISFQMVDVLSGQYALINQGPLYNTVIKGKVWCYCLGLIFFYHNSIKEMAGTNPEHICSCVLIINNNYKNIQMAVKVKNLTGSGTSFLHVKDNL